MTETEDKIVIYREWNNPEIKVKFDSQGVFISLSASDFIKLVSDEVGNPTFKFTKASISRALGDVIEKLKKTTAQV